MHFHLFTEYTVAGGLDTSVLAHYFILIQESGRPLSAKITPSDCTLSVISTYNLTQVKSLPQRLGTIHHVLESGLSDMICENICSAAAPRWTPRHRYAGTSCPAPKTRRYENVPAFLYRPAGLPLTIYVAKFCFAYRGENTVLKESICACSDGVSVKVRRSRRKHDARTMASKPI
jgi:hypothetical protein